MQMRSSYVNKVGRERERERDLACACGVRVCFLQSWLKNLKDPPLFLFVQKAFELNSFSSFDLHATAPAAAAAGISDGIA